MDLCVWKLQTYCECFQHCGLLGLTSRWSFRVMHASWEIFTQGDACYVWDMFDKTYQPPKKKKKKNDWCGRAKLWKTVETWKYWERFRRNTKSIVKVHFKVPFCTEFELNTLIWNTPDAQAVKNQRVWNTREGKKGKFKCWVRNECQRSSPA